MVVKQVINSAELTYFGRVCIVLVEISPVPLCTGRDCKIIQYVLLIDNIKILIIFLACLISQYQRALDFPTFIFLVRIFHVCLCDFPDFASVLWPPVHVHTLFR